jgi:DNA replication protein DnaC
VLHDGDLAEAILDRLLERGTHYVLRGRSYRTRHLKVDASTTAEDAA